jgi:acetolactate decarboxylase
MDTIKKQFWETIQSVRTFRMNPKRIISILVISILLSGFIVGCEETTVDNDRIYQVSTLQALMLGLYDGETTVAQLRRRGNHGIGTFNALDGEMVILDKMVYRIGADGKVTAVLPETKTPFACVTFFEPDLKFPLSGGRDFDQLKNALDAWLPTTNLPYAVHITGTFRYVKTRSVPKQSNPYPPLAEVAKTQPTFEFQNVEGVMIGFRLPEYFAGINMAGYHLHFLTGDRKGGGHVLEFTARDAVVEVDDCRELLLLLPDAKTFTGLDLTKVNEKDIHAVESTTQPATQPTTQKSNNQ